MDKELTDEEMARIDHIQNETYNYLRRMMPEGKEIGWDLNLIHEVIEDVWDRIKDLGICTEMEFYPYRES